MRAAALLLIEKLLEVSHVQAEAIRNLPIEKIFVWDGGNAGAGMDGLGRRIMGVLPPMHELAKQVGLDLPEFLGQLANHQAAGDEASPLRTRSEPAANVVPAPKTPRA